MEKTIEKMLHIPCEEKDFNRIEELPLLLRSAYQLKVMQMSNTSFLTALPREKTNFATMRKHRDRLMEISGMECAFCFETVSAYAKRKMLEEGIPFIVQGRELYLPFLGMALNNAQKEKTPPARISYLTQKMLLTAFYQKLSDTTVTEMAKIMEVSKMSITRCFDELEAFELGMIVNKGKAGRFFHWNKGKAEFWEVIRPILRNPVEKEILLDCEPPWSLPKSGLSAISDISMVADNSYPTYAVAKQAIKDLHPEKLPQVPRGELPSAIIQVMGYTYQEDESAIDPISAVLTLTEEEQNDPRIEGAIEEIMEEYIHDRD